MKLSDELKEARRKIEVAIGEADLRAQGRVFGSGRNYGLEARIAGKIPQTRDGQKGR